MVKVYENGWMPPAKQRPVVRVGRALQRITRSRWICGDEFEHIARVFLRSACWRNHSSVGIVRAYAFPIECRIVGMYMGRPPASPGDYDYHDFLTFLGRFKKTPDDAKVELWILSRYLKRMAKNHGK